MVLWEKWQICQVYNLDYLNRSRGPAVRGPRTQSDRSLYKKYMQEKLVNYCNLSIFSDPVIKFNFKNNDIIGFINPIR